MKEDLSDALLDLLAHLHVMLDTIDQAEDPNSPDEVAYWTEHLAEARDEMSRTLANWPEALASLRMPLNALPESERRNRLSNVRHELRQI